MEPRTVIGWIILGLLAGAIAKALRPGKDPGGWIASIIIGLIGSFIGGWIANSVLGWNTADSWWQTFFVAIAGAILVLWLYALATRRR